MKPARACRRIHETVELPVAPNSEIRQSTRRGKKANRPIRGPGRRGSPVRRDGRTVGIRLFRLSERGGFEPLVRGIRSAGMPGRKGTVCVGVRLSERSDYVRSRLSLKVGLLHG
jgi:hypothetical protein